MPVWKYLFAGLNVAVLLLLYNLAVFWFFDFYPDVEKFVFLPDASYLVYLFIFLKGFIVGTLLMFLYGRAYSHIQKDGMNNREVFIAVSYFFLYAVFAFSVFVLSDLWLFERVDGFIVMLTVDNLVEVMISMVPVRVFFY